jgi:hypothetical protein
MCNGGELFGEILAPDRTAGKIWRAFYYLALLAIFAFGLYLAIDSGAFG